MNDDKIEVILQLQDRMSKQLDGVVANLGRAEKATGGLEGTLGRLGTIAAATFAVDKIKDFVGASLDAFGKYEQFNVALKTMLHGNAVEAESLNTKLINFAKTTPFELTGVQDATRQLIAYGFESQKIEGTLRTIGDVASGVGAPLGDIAYLYGTLKTQGKAMSKDLYQFANRGIPIIAALAKHFKIAEDQVFKFAEQGKISFKDIEKSFQGMTGEGGQFFNMMEAQSKTLDGQLSNLNDSFDQLKVGIGDALSESYKEFIGFVSNITNEAANAMRQMNRVSKTISKSGGGTTTMEDITMEETGRLSVQQDILDKVVEDAAKGNVVKALKMVQTGIDKAKEDYQMGVYADKSGSDAIGTKHFLHDITQLEDAKSRVINEIENLKKKTAGSAADRANTIESKTKNPREIHGNTPKNIYITVNKQIDGGVTINSQNLNEGVNDIVAMLAKGLLTTVHDANMAIQD